MAQNKNRKKKNKKVNGNHDILGVVLIVISAFLLLCIVIKPILGVFSEAIFSVLLGVFGIAAYPLLIAVLILGICILGGHKAQAGAKTKVCIAFAVIFALLILQLASTHAFLPQKFSAYMSSVYSCKYSAGGLIMGLLAFGLKSLITEIACYIIFSLAFIIDILVMTSAIKRLRIFAAARKMKKTAEPAEPQIEEPQLPPQAQLVVDATPTPGLFTGRIENTHLTEMSVETGTATDTQERTPRPISDYSETPVLDDVQPQPDRSPATTAALIKIYSDREEIRRQAAESFRSPHRQEQPAHIEYADNDPDSAADSGEYIVPAQRVQNDAQHFERPRRVDFEGTPNNFNALYFPLDKNIQFNDEGIEIMEDPHPAPARPEPRRDIEYERPTFGMPGAAPALEHVEPIIDASRSMGRTEPPPIIEQEPIITADSPVSLSVEDRFLRTFGSAEQSARVLEREPEHVHPLESEKFKAEEIWDASDELNKIGARADEPGQSGIPQQEEIMDGSAPFDPGFFGQSEIEEITPDNAQDEALIISDEPALDLSERNFDNGDVFTGQDLSGMYVSADDDEELPPIVEQPKPSRSKKSNAPLDNQISIGEVMQEQASGSVVAGAKRYKQYNYKAPPYNLLKVYDKKELSQEELDANARTLEEVVSQFVKAPVSVINIVPGPQVTRYELEVPSGTSVKTIEARSADIAYELAAVSGVRVEAPIPGKRAIGIEVPNRSKSIVGLREVVDSPVFTRHKSPMVFSVGKDIGGDLVVCDLEKIPHLLIAGQTGSGKSAGLNSLIVSLLYKSSPDDLRFILIDPKRVEFSKFRGMPHLLFEKTITEPGEALNALKWTENEMNRRYTVLQQFACSKLSEYNSLPEVKSGKISKLPHIIIIIDELANLMQSNVSGEIETKISSIAALARAAGIHLIVATQRPSADVITGTIKANLTSRIAFKVPDATNSRIIIDGVGAEALSGDGDMLFYPQDSTPRRVQGSFVSGEEVLAVVSYLKDNYECDFDEEAEKYVSGGGGGGSSGGSGTTEFDPLASRIMSHAIKAKQISTSVIQRRFSIGFARAARIIDNMEELGYIGPITSNSKPRDVFMTVEQYRSVFGHDLDEN